MNKLVCIQYQIPPMRAIWTIYYPENKSLSDDDYKKKLIEEKPRAIIMKITREIKDVSNT